MEMVFHLQKFYQAMDNALFDSVVTNKYYKSFDVAVFVALVPTKTNPPVLTESFLLLY